MLNNLSQTAMKQLFFFCLTAFFALDVMAQGAQPPQPEFLPGAIYEVRYWQNLSGMGEAGIMIDTMIYQQGYDRAGFDYQNSECVSYHCKETDDMVYSLLPNFKPDAAAEWTMKDKFIRKIQTTKVPFRSVNRDIHMVYVADKGTEISGYGDYSMVSKEFGVVSRWNGDGEFFQLLRIDVYRDGNLLQEIDILPLHDRMYASGAYRLRQVGQ